MHSIIIIKNPDRPIPFPSNAQRNDTADVYFAAKANQRLVQSYTFDGRTWQYTGYRLENISA
jgi:hypothetical protein